MTSQPQGGSAPESKRGYETVDVQGFEASPLVQPAELDSSRRRRSRTGPSAAAAEWRGFMGCVLLLLIAILIAIAGLPSEPERGTSTGMDFCLEKQSTWTLTDDTPEAPPSTSVTLFTDCTIWTGSDRGSLEGASLLVSAGKIAAIGAAALRMAPADATSVDCNGDWITPGIIDIHSHLGVGAYPSDWGGHSDTNEYTASGPGMGGIESMVRALDGVDPEDPAIPQIRSGGVTTSQVLPGS
eukprot:SAG31_NODE_10465_length_1135_cov_1.632239_1_plen_240_part_01